VSSKFAQIKALGFKLAPLRGGLYTGERPQGHHGPLVFIELHIQCFIVVFFQIFFLFFPCPFHKTIGLRISYEMYRLKRMLLDAMPISSTNLNVTKKECSKKDNT
jgi:hypothetical protein